MLDEIYTESLLGSHSAQDTQLVVDPLVSMEIAPLEKQGEPLTVKNFLDLLKEHLSLFGPSPCFEVLSAIERAYEKSDIEGALSRLTLFEELLDRERNKTQKLDN